MLAVYKPKVTEFWETEWNRGLFIRNFISICLQRVASNSEDIRKSLYLRKTISSKMVSCWVRRFREGYPPNFGRVKSGSLSLNAWRSSAELRSVISEGGIRKSK